MWDVWDARGVGAADGVLTGGGVGCVDGVRGVDDMVRWASLDWFFHFRDRRGNCQRTPRSSRQREGAGRRKYAVRLGTYP